MTYFSGRGVVGCWAGWVGGWGGGLVVGVGGSRARWWERGRGRAGDA